MVQTFSSHFPNLLPFCSLGGWAGGVSAVTCVLCHGPARRLLFFRHSGVPSVPRNHTPFHSRCNFQPTGLSRGSSPTAPPLAYPRSLWRTALWAPRVPSIFQSSWNPSAFPPLINRRFGHYLKNLDQWLVRSTRLVEVSFSLPLTTPPTSKFVPPHRPDF